MPPEPPQGADGAEDSIPAKVKKLLEKPTQEEVIALMRDDHLRSYRVDIETDSTVEVDEQAEKETRNEFLGAVGAFLQTALPAAQADKKLMPMLGEMLMFTVRGYRAGRQLEDVIEQTVDEMVEAASEPAQPKPDPKQVEVEGNLKLDAEKLKADVAEREARMEMDKAKTAQEMQQSQTKFELELAALSEQRQMAGLPPLQLPEVSSATAAADRIEQMMPQMAQFISQSLQQAAQQQTAALEAISQRQQMSDQAQMQTADALQRMAAAIQGLATQVGAPAEVIRDGEGKVVGVRKGSMTQQVTRAPDGSVMGVQ